MNRPHLGFLLALVLIPICSAIAQLSPVAQTNSPPLRTAIFVQNRAGPDFQNKLDVLNDMITARLTEQGFSIIDKSDVVAKFRESREPDSATKAIIRGLTDLIKSGKTETTIEDAITDASALRISQMIGADYLVFATINSVGQETRRFKGQGTVVGADSSVTIHTLRIALKVLEGSQGGSVYGDVVTASEKVATLEHLESTSTDITNKLLDNGAIQIAQNIADKVERIRTVQVKTLPTVEFTIKSNIEDATVELDGAVIGSAPGRFNAAPGLHQMRIGKEFFASWEKTVNIYPNQLLTVTLEMSDEGLRRYKNIETYKAEMANTKQEMELAKKTTDQELDLTKKEREAAVEMSREANSAEVYRVKSDAEIAKEQSVADAEVKRQQSAADADAKRNISEGEKKKREQSYIHDDGLGNEIKQIIHGGN